MTPLRALIAGLLAAILFGAGLFIVASLADGRPHELVPLLSPGRSPFVLWCFLAAWGALILGSLGVLAGFFAFIAPEEEDDPRFRRRGFPKSAPIILIAIALGLAFLAIRCADEDEPPIAIAAAPEAIETGPGTPLLGDEEIAPEPTITTPPVEVGVAAFQWRYMDPLMREPNGIWARNGLPFSDDDENARLLCRKAWVAVTGSASEEGPAARNAARARLRTMRAMAQAEIWLAAHTECGPTVILGVDLGQHAPTGPIDDEGAATAYQRQVLVASRKRSTVEDNPDQSAAESELRAFLAEPANRAALYAGRQFPAEPAIIAR
ncbi:MAG: hypothetical protein ACOZAA_11375 [Pseudomonadota bacterium]